MTHIYLSVLFMFAAIALGLIVSSSDIKLWKKLTVIGTLSICALISYRALNVMYGYPTLLQDDMRDVLILSFYADRENKIVYVWVKKDDEAEPRCYKMPYDPKLHSKLDKNASLSDNKPYRGNISLKNFPGERFTESTDEVDVETEQGDLPIWPNKSSN